MPGHPRCAADDDRLLALEVHQPPSRSGRLAGSATCGVESSAFHGDRRRLSPWRRPQDRAALARQEPRRTSTSSCQSTGRSKPRPEAEEREVDHAGQLDGVLVAQRRRHVQPVRPTRRSRSRPRPRAPVLPAWPAPLRPAAEDEVRLLRAGDELGLGLAEVQPQVREAPVDADRAVHRRHAGRHDHPARQALDRIVELGDQAVDELGVAAHRLLVDGEEQVVLAGEVLVERAQRLAATSATSCTVSDSPLVRSSTVAAARISWLPQSMERTRAPSSSIDDAALPIRDGVVRLGLRHHGLAHVSQATASGKRRSAPRTA